MLCCSSVYAQDWPNLQRFAAENAAVLPPAPTEQRVVFMGNSITESWAKMDTTFFANKAYLNRGISGQTTPQMLLRFRADVVNLQPAVVVILAGTNDIAGNTGPATIDMIVGNIQSMAEIAAANGIKVVLASVLPVYDYPWKPGLEPAKKIIQLNALIQAYARAHDHVYLDYFSAMADARNGLQATLTYDGVHPNLAGYAVMAPLAEAAIAIALATK